MRAAAIVLAVAALATGGCAQRIAQGRVRSALVDAGVSRPDAACMAQRMVDRLSIDQLRRLEGLKARAGERKRPVALPDILNRIRRVGDIEVVTVTASSAALCHVGLADEAR